MTEKIPLGRTTAYPEQYSPGLLYAIARTGNREALGLGVDLPFHGTDIWNAWELVVSSIPNPMFGFGLFS